MNLNIGGTIIIQDEDGRVHWTSKADIDADGANGQNGKPFAYRSDNKGLDTLRDIPREDLLGTDGHGGLYSATTYRWTGRPIATAYVDAATVPYIVVPPQVRLQAKGIVMGCKGRIIYRGRSVNAVVADVGPHTKIGEISIAAAEALGIPSSPLTGGVSNGVQYEIWPGVPAVVNGETYELQPA